LDDNSCLKSLFPSLTQRDTEKSPENVGKAKEDQINGSSTKPKGRVRQSKIIFRFWCLNRLGRGNFLLGNTTFPLSKHIIKESKNIQSLPKTHQ